MTTTTKKPYHHGDLLPELIKQGLKLIEQDGIEGLSLRKLAEQAGVSRTAAYHYFANKTQLLCAISAEGFKIWHSECQQILSNKSISEKQKFQQYVHGYIHFALTHKNLYRLMFGAVIWQQNQSNETLKQQAYPSFQQQIDITRYWQQQGILNNNQPSLRLAQVLWGALHGIASLAIDGIYQTDTPIHAMCETLIETFLSQKP